MTLFTAVMIQGGVYLAVLVIAFIIFNFLSKGYLRVYLMVKASRGKKILVRALSFTGYYYRAGNLDNAILTFKNKAKVIDSYRIRKTDIFLEMGVNVICVDETTKKIIHINNDPREGHDTEHIDSLIKRALYKPSMRDNPKEMILIVLAVISTIASVITLYLVYTMTQTGGAGGVV